MTTKNNKDQTALLIAKEHKQTDVGALLERALEKQHLLKSILAAMDESLDVGLNF